MTDDSDPRWTGAAKLCPASVEQTATTWPTMSPDESCWVVQSQTAHTKPCGPVASSGPALATEGTLASTRILRVGSKLFPPSVERVQPGPACATTPPPTAQTIRS